MRKARVISRASSSSNQSSSRPAPRGAGRSFWLRLPGASQTRLTFVFVSAYRGASSRTSLFVGARGAGSGSEESRSEEARSHDPWRLDSSMGSTLTSTSRRLAAVISATVILLAFAACGSGDSAAPDSPAASDRPARHAGAPVEARRESPGIPSRPKSGAPSGSNEEPAATPVEAPTPVSGGRGGSPKRPSETERDAPPAPFLGLSGDAVEVEPVTPGSSDCRVTLGGSSTTLPCEPAQSLFGGK